jgi:hypothetical protein
MPCGRARHLRGRHKSSLGAGESKVVAAQPLALTRRGIHSSCNASGLEMIGWSTRALKIRWRQAMGGTAQDAQSGGCARLQVCTTPHRRTRPVDVQIQPMGVFGLLRIFQGS